MMRTIPFRNGSRSRVEGHATAGEGTRLKGIVLCPFSRNLPYEYIRNTVRHSRWGTVEKWQRPQVKTCVHGPPWDYKAFEKFDFSMIGHFDENGKTLKSISRFEHMYYTISVSYWLILLISVLSGNKLLAQLAQFRVFVTAMCASSFAFASWFAARLIKDVRQHLEQNEMDQDISGLYRYAWRAIFWLAFVMFYTVPPVYSLTAYFAIPGAVMCLYGLALAGFSALIVGTWSFMGDPNVPHRLITVGPYALLRHPQALGNILFLVGFSLSGGAIASSLAFALSFFLYSTHVIPLEEQMLSEAFPSSYAHYKERVPMFSWALVLLLVLEMVLILRYGIGY